MIARLFSGMVSMWLLTSLLLWDQSTAQTANVLLVGGATLILLPASYIWPKLRYGIAALGYWLAFSSLTISFLGDTALTACDHITSGVLLLLFAIGPFSRLSTVPVAAAIPAMDEEDQIVTARISQAA